MLGKYLSFRARARSSCFPINQDVVAVPGTCGMAAIVTGNWLTLIDPGAEERSCSMSSRWPRKELKKA